MLKKMYEMVMSITVEYDNIFNAKHDIELSNVEDYISGEMLMYGFSKAIVCDRLTGEVIVEIENTDGIIADELLS